MHQGLLLAIRLGYEKLVIEGDSELVTNTLKTLNQGTKWGKLSQRWNNSSHVQGLEDTNKKFDYIIITHVRREGNITVDLLENCGCSHLNEPIELSMPPNLEEE